MDKNGHLSAFLDIIAACLAIAAMVILFLAFSMVEF